jgi:ribose-phosphate pyrophosphokinase
MGHNIETSSSTALLSSPETSGTTEAVRRILQKRGLHYPHIEVAYRSHPGGEVDIELPKTVRNKKVYVIHSPQLPDPNTGSVRTMLTCDAIDRAGGREIVLVLPHMTYTRQDRMNKPRVCISSKVIAQAMTANPRVRSVLPFDLHVPQGAAFFNVPAENLTFRPIFVSHFRKVFKDNLANLVVMAPDVGALDRAIRFATALGEEVQVGNLIKSRRKGVKIEGYNGPPIVDRYVLMFDDIGDTMGTAIHAINFIRDILKPADVQAAFSHGIFSNDGSTGAEFKMRNSGIKVTITDSIPRSVQYKVENADWLTVLPIDKLLADIIHQAELPGGVLSKYYY